MMNENIQKLKNGLTTDQVTKAKAILSQVNVSEICRELKIPRPTVNHVLNGTSKKVTQLLDVVSYANQKISHARDTFKNL